MRSVFSRASLVSELCVNTVCACSLVRDGLVCGTSFFDPLSTSVFCPSPGLFTLFTIHVLNLFLVLGPVFSTERSAGLRLTALVVSHCFFLCDHVRRGVHESVSVHGDVTELVGSSEHSKDQGASGNCMPE